MGSKNNVQICAAKFAILIGAGVSIPIGIPAMRGIYTDFLKPSKSGITPTERRTCDLLVRRLNVPPDLEEFLLAANAIVDFKGSSLSSLVEKCVSTRQSGTRIQTYRNRLNEKTANVLATRTRILKYLSETCFRFNRDKACRAFNPFVQSVADIGCPIFSTNYDYALEHVAIEAGIAIEDNFRRVGPRQIWNPDIHFPTGNALTLIKLHGSVTWYADDTGEIERIPHDTSINAVGRDVDQLIIFPTRFKDIYEQHFFALYSHFLSVLSRAEVLIIAGHSLRDDYLRAAIIEQFRKKALSLIVIDPKFPPDLISEITPARIGQSGRVTHIPYKFEDFSNDLAHIMTNHPPEEIPSRCAEIVHFVKSRSNKISIKGRIGKLKARDTIQFTVAIDAYVKLENRPACLRVWIHDGQRGPMSERQNNRFLDNGSILVGAGPYGMVKEEVSMQVLIPKSPKWAEVRKVSLRVALVRSSIKYPRQASVFGIIASDTRQLTYSIE